MARIMRRSGFLARSGLLVVSASLLIRTFYHMVNLNNGFDATMLWPSKCL